MKAIAKKVQEVANDTEAFSPLNSLAAVAMADFSSEASTVPRCDPFLPM
jgi:hypothetical protein